MVGDPIADMVNRIKTAGNALQDSIVVPFSKIKFEIAKVLKTEGFIKSVQVLDEDKVGVSKKLEIGILYKLQAKTSDKKIPKINEVVRVSKFSRRVYTPISALYSILGGRGIAVLSTTKGILSDKMARREKIGGEYLLKIW